MLKTEIPSVCKARRERLMARAPEACFIFFGAPEPSGLYHRVPFRQGSDFFYLTEFDEPGAALVMAGGKSHLFVQDREESQEIWTGERYGAGRALDVFKVDGAHRMIEFESKVDLLLKDSNEVYFSLGSDLRSDERVMKILQQAQRHRGKGRLGHLPIRDPQGILSEFRSVKDTVEIDRLRTACAHTAQAHLHLLKTLRPGMSEFEAANEFQYRVFGLGCTDLGYSPIFANGVNATTLHYVRNNDRLKSGDLLLVDAGGEFQGYTADLTQTFPVSATFSSAQRQVYESVLKVNRQITQMVRPGVAYRTLHQRCVELLTEELLSLGVLSGDLRHHVNTQSYRPYFPHGLGHYLGLDVHDAGIYHDAGGDFLLRPGMVLTNEPGLYFRDQGSPFYGIGVRIEDDLLVTENGAEVLTSALPREVEEIEALRAKALA